MDPQRILYGRVTHGDSQVDLGRATFETMLKRLAITSRSIPGQAKRIIVELSADPITDLSHASRSVQIEAELESSILRTSEVHEEWRPGISFERMGEAIDSESYKAYARICEPNKRLGLTELRIEQIRLAYEHEWPDVSQHIPVWIQ